MSLVVWLPLTKDLRQQGLANTSSFSLVSGNSLVNGGKVGGQCLVLTKRQTILENNSCMTNKKQMSYAYWIKVNTAWSSNWLDGIRWVSSNDSTSSISRQEFYDNCTKIGIWFPSSSTGSIYGKDFTPGVWTHLAATFNYNTGDVSFYINGVLQGYVTTLDTTYYCRGDFYLGDEGVDISMNDVRIYDHCLSPMEVKELAKGLILHYPLNRQGWGQENFYTGNGIAPCGTGISSYTNNGYEHHSVWSNAGTARAQNLGFNGKTGPWTVSFDIKSNVDANLTVDVCDKGYATATYGTNLIANQWMHKSFIITTATNQYNTSGNYNGFVDFNYNKAGTLDIKNLKVEEGVIETPWCPSSNHALATTMDLNSTTEYDCSGFGNNGTRVGTFSWTSDTPKYSVSTFFPTSGNNYIKIGTQLYNMKDEMTVSIWVKPNDWTSTSKGVPFSSVEGGGFGWQASSANYVFYCGSGTSSNTYLSSTVAVSGLSAGWHMLSATYNGLVLKIYIDGELKNTVTKYTTKTPIYYNINSGMFVSGESGGSLTAPNGSIFRGNLSDLRIYAVALSDTDIKSLYNNCAYIDNSGNVYGAVHEEV